MEPIKIRAVVFLKSASIFEFLLFVIGGVGAGVIVEVEVEVGLVELDVYN